CFRPILEFRMGSCLSEVERFDIGGDRAGQPLANTHPSDVHRLLVEAARGIEFQHAFAQEVDRADFAAQRLADDLHDLVQLALRMQARSHDLMQLGEDRASSGGGGNHELPPIATRADWEWPSADPVSPGQIAESSSLMRNFCFLSL